jgi:hypothetical protein
MRDQVVESSIPNAVAAAGEIETLHFRTVCEESEQYFVARTAGILAAEPTKVWTCFYKADGGCVRHVVALVGVVVTSVNSNLNSQRVLVMLWPRNMMSSMCLL